MTSKEIDKLKDILIGLGTTNEMNWSTYWRLEELRKTLPKNAQFEDLKAEDLLSILLVPQIRETLKEDRAQNLAVLKNEYGLDLSFWQGFTSHENLAYLADLCGAKELKKIKVSDFGNSPQGKKLLEFIHNIEDEFKKMLKRIEDKKTEDAYNKWFH